MAQSGMQQRPDRFTDEVARVLGTSIVVAAAAGLLLSLVMDWYTVHLPCVKASCRGVSGWQVLGGEDLALSSLALLGFALPLCSRLRWAPQLAGGLVALALAAAALTVVRIVLPPGGQTSLFGPTPGAGAIVALASALLLAGGAMLAAVGDRFFETTRGATPAIVLAWLVPPMLIVSLALPWVKPGAAPDPGPRPVLPAPIETLSGWEAFAAGDLLIALCSAALLAGAGVVTVLRWRGVLLAIALGAWVSAALALGYAHGAERGGYVIFARSDSGPINVAEAQWGMWVAVAAAASLVVACLVGAVGGVEPRRARPGRSAEVPDR